MQITKSIQKVHWHLTHVPIFALLQRLLLVDITIRFTVLNRLSSLIMTVITIVVLEYHRMNPLRLLLHQRSQARKSQIQRRRSALQSAAK